MAEPNPKNDDEIDLIELFFTLWAGKWIILGCTVISLTVAGAYLAMVEPEYESRILIEQNNIPAFLRKMEVNSTSAAGTDDFIELFNSDKLLENWTSSNKSRLDLRQKNYSNFNVPKNTPVELVLNSNETEILDAHFEYAIFVNRFLTEEYRKRSGLEAAFLNEQAREIGNYSDPIVNLLIDTNRFLNNIENGGLVLSIKEPTNPIKVAPKTELILALALVLGGFIGCAIVILLSVIKKHRLQEEANITA